MRRVEVSVFNHGSRCQDAGDVAPHDLVLHRWLNLVADHDFVPGAKQLAHVCLPGVVWHAAHRRAAALAERSRREGHTHHRCGDLRVLKEDLVEVSEPEEEDSVGVLLFRLPVLPHHRGESKFTHAAGSPMSWPAVAWRTRTFIN